MVTTRVYSSKLSSTVSDSIINLIKSLQVNCRALACVLGYDSETKRADLALLKPGVHEGREEGRGTVSECVPGRVAHWLFGVLGLFFTTWDLGHQGVQLFDS